VVWKGDAIRADFDCDGDVDFALLGTSGDRVVVAVFPARKSKRPQTLQGQIVDLDMATMRLEPEALDVSDEDFEQMVVLRPAGYRRSTRCKGLILTDDLTDPLHIYWNQDHDGLAAWRL